MKRILITLLIGFSFIPTTWADFPNPNESFHPQHYDYYNDNLRVKLKNRANIERASESTVHYDEYVQDYYRCNWDYNKNLGTWVCNKAYLESNRNQEITCGHGQKLNPWKTGCEPIQIPANAQLNRQGNGWECISGYQLNSAYTGCEPINRPTYTYQPNPVYIPPVNTVQYEILPNQQPTSYRPVQLAATGNSIFYLYLFSILGGLLLTKLRRQFA